MTFNPNRPGELAAGAQDNGSWMSVPGTKTWVETFVADGAYNGFDAVDPNYSSLSWQGGALAILDEPRNQEAPFWIADTLLTTGRGAVPLLPRGGRRSSSPTVFHPNVEQAHVHEPRARVPVAERRRQPELPVRQGEGALQPLDRRRRHRRERHLPAGDRRLRRLEGDGRSRATSAGSPTARRRPVRRRRTRPARGRWRARRRTRGATTAPAGTSRSTRRRRPTRTSSGRRPARGRDLRHDERGCGESGHDRLAPDRPDVDGRPAAVPDGHLRRPVEPEPRAASRTAATTT